MLYGVDEESVSENLVKINVYYTSLNQKSIEDKIDYSLQVRWLKLSSHRQRKLSSSHLQDGSLFSALGGCLSLWLGISFCALFEILELALDLLWNIIQASGGSLGRASNTL